MQACAGPVHAPAVSVFPTSLTRVDLEGPVFLRSSIPSASYTLSTSSSTGFPEPWGEGFDGDISFRTQHSKVSLSLPAQCLAEAYKYVQALLRKKKKKERKVYFQSCSEE